jgi:hypothetical protein
MRCGLYCYFGRFGDHTAPIPGHPLYQIFFLNALAKKYEIDKFDIFYYDSEYPSIPNLNDRFEILPDIRNALRGRLVGKDGVSLAEALSNSYDKVFTKYRFRNYSRLSEGSLDRYKFEKIIEKHKDKCIVVDTDAEIKEEYPRILSLFADSEYKYLGIPQVDRVIPVLRADVHRAVKCWESIPNKWSCLTFIGNGYNKDGLLSVLKRAQKDAGVSIVIHGKHKDPPLNFKVISRTERVRGYRCLAESLLTVQLSKPVYEKYNFMSPRIFESYLLGTLCFSQNSFMGGFSRFNGAIDLIEKIKFLKTVSHEDYFKILTEEIDKTYDNLEYKLGV